MTNKSHYHAEQAPAKLLVDHRGLFTESPLQGPLLDLASGDCRNGIFLARQNLKVVCCDASAEALARGKRQAAREGVRIETEPHFVGLSVVDCGLYV